MTAIAAKSNYTIYFTLKTELLKRKAKTTQAKNTDKPARRIGNRTSIVATTPAIIGGMTKAKD